MGTGNASDHSEGKEHYTKSSSDHSEGSELKEGLDGKGKEAGFSNDKGNILSNIKQIGGSSPNPDFNSSSVVGSLDSVFRF